MPGPTELQQIFAGVLTPTQLAAQRAMRDTQMQQVYGEDTARPWRLELARSLDTLASRTPGTPQYQQQQQATSNQDVLNRVTKGYKAKTDSGMTADQAQLSVLNDAITEFANQGNYDAVSALAPAYLAMQNKQAQTAKLFQEGQKEAVDTAARAQDSNSLAASRASEIKERERKARNDEAKVDTRDIVDLVNPKAGPITAAINPDGSATFTDASGQVQTRKPGQYKSAPTGNAAAGGAQDQRTAMYFQRVAGAGDLGVTSLENIAASPLSSAKGTFNGVKSDGGLLSTPKVALANTLTSEESRDYQTMISGLKRNLATIETSGLAPGAHFTESLQAVEFQPGDTNMNKLRKLAESRQIIEHGLNSIVTNPKLTDEQKDYVKSIQDRVKEAIPYTVMDVIKLKAAKDPKTTLNDVMKKTGLAGGKESAADRAKRLGVQ